MGANDPIYTSNEPLSDALATAITKAVGFTLADRSAGGILANPVIGAAFLGTAMGSGALGSKLVDIGWGANKLASVAEGTDATVYTLDSDAATVTVARRAFARKVSDMGRLLDGMSITDWVNFAVDSTIGWEQTVVSVLAALATSFSTDAGNSGGTLTWGHIVDAYHDLGQAEAQGRAVLVLPPKHWSQVSQDAMALGGRVAQRQETDGFFGPVVSGYRGTYMNGGLDVYTSAECPTSGGDTVGMMVTSQAVAWDAGVPVPSPATIPLLRNELFMAELGRSALKNEDQVVTSSMIGASIRQNSAGVKLSAAT